MSTRTIVRHAAAKVNVARRLAVRRCLGGAAGDARLSAQAAARSKSQGCAQ